ncbi:MAG: asparagine synthase (glutamine-hydrolyzing) [Deltaproteobacteria bacterium]|nr:asparagine synthase (glutamine-hydrolyzing) [Deltaproteobacteria bacterium]TLN04303.1 MAG: asparagine synthase (glutamine-hydrolyzing) [bacterium]
MCGIAGILNLTREMPPTMEQITSMISTLRHRGPDETGIYRDTRIALGHLRLSIIGVANGIQPISNEDETLWIIYNGEAFNYVELKTDLIKKGHCFRTETDTEVLLHLFEEYGTGCLEKINGQFSVAIWDARNEKLFLARDRVGIRPLYYTWSGGKLIFSSEIKAILTVGGTRELDLEALAQVFEFWTTLPGRTVFKEIHELQPGHYMIVKDARSHPEPYWSIPFYPPEEITTRSLTESAEELRELLKDAVRVRLRADVPVGAYLSGGLDSSIIAMLISRNFDTQLKTFSLGFQESAFDETPYQEELVRFLGVEHRRILVSGKQIRGLFPETVWHCEKPILRTAPVPLFILSDLVHREGYKVALCGEGADEILGGYDIFKEAKIRSFWGRQPDSKRRPLLLERLYPYVFNNPSRGRLFLQNFFAVRPEDLQEPFFSHMVRWENSRKNLTFFSDDSIAALSGYDPLHELAERLPQGFCSRDPVTRAQNLETEIFLANYLLSSQGDRIAMAHSVELRHPFLDYRVVDFSSRLPVKWKIRGLHEKFILKEAFHGLIPERIERRAKQPYRAPIRKLFSPEAPPDYVDELLSVNCLKNYGYFNTAKVRRLLEKYRQPDNGFSSEFQNMALIGVLSTQILHRQFVEGVPPYATERISPDKVIDRSRERTT